MVLDQITDPHNVGAILRTACAFGADAVITTMRFAPQETGVLAKSASGALDYTNLIEVKNLATPLQELKNHGFTCLGFDSEAEGALTPDLKAQKLAIVLGAEHKGLRQRTRELCDQMVKLDMPGADQIAQRVQCSGNRLVCRNIAIDTSILKQGQ